MFALFLAFLWYCVHKNETPSSHIDLDLWPMTNKTWSGNPWNQVDVCSKNFSQGTLEIVLTRMEQTVRRTTQNIKHKNKIRLSHTSVMSPYWSSARSGRRQQASRTALYLLKKDPDLGIILPFYCSCSSSLYSNWAYLSWSYSFPKRMFSFSESQRIQACCGT